MLDELVLRDFIDWCRRTTVATPYQPPEFFFIAHSLGSVASFDALAYGHASQDVRKLESIANHSCPSLPFVGYTFDRDEEKGTWRNLLKQVTETTREEELVNGLPRHPADIWKDLKSAGAASKDNFLKIPPVLWRGCVSNLITLGSPIDKYHVLWFQNYFHMGLRLKTETEPDEFKKLNSDGTDWLEEPALAEKILHHNLCDEQDPVGHHLDVTRASKNYPKVFDTKTVPDVHRDVVFRRYAVPGVAHVEYWTDRELFKGIVKAVIERGHHQDAGDDYFSRQEFRVGDGSTYRRAVRWAYFLLPFGAAVVTGLLLVYAVFGEVAIYRVGAFIAAVLLWSMPKPGAEYLKEARPAAEGNVGARTKWRFRRGILATLVAAMVEWRSILISLSEGQSTDLDGGRRLAFVRSGGQRTLGEFWTRGRWRFAGALLSLGSFVALAWISDGRPPMTNALAEARAVVAGMFGSMSTTVAAWLWKFGVGGTVMSVTYLATMTYVAYLYEKQRRQ